MAESIEIEGNEYEVSGYADDGLPILKATVVSTQDGFDEDGNPKISVNINVPIATPRTPEEREADRLKELFKEGV